MVAITLVAGLVAFSLSKIEPYRQQDLAMRRLHKKQTPLPDGSQSITRSGANLRLMITSQAIVRATIPQSRLERLAVENVIGENRCLRIQELNIRSNVDKKDISFVLSRMPFLRKLDFDYGSSLSKDTIRQIAKLGLLSLDVAHCNLSDSDVKELCKSESIEHLCLDFNEITDDVVPHLEQIKNLKRLDIWWTGISQESVQRLRKNLPNCKVHCLN